MEITRKEQEFQTTDWYGYSGAISKNGQEPLIAQFVDRDSDATIDLLMSYAEPEEDSTVCSIELNVFIGDDNVAYYDNTCYNWEVGYELFRDVYRILETRAYEEAVGAVQDKGFRLQRF